MVFLKKCCLADLSNAWTAYRTTKKGNHKKT